MTYKEIKERGYTVRTVFGTIEEIRGQITGKLIGVNPETFGFSYTKTVLSVDVTNDFVGITHDYLHLSTENHPNGWLSTHTTGKAVVQPYFIIEKI